MAAHVIVTVVGKNRPGVLAEVSRTIARCQMNILDVHQKMIRDYFNLFMIVDLNSKQVTFHTFKEKLESLGDGKGYRVSVQHERIFQDMHRL